MHVVSLATEFMHNYRCERKLGRASARTLVHVRHGRRVPRGYMAVGRNRVPTIEGFALGLALGHGGADRRVVHRVIRH